MKTCDICGGKLGFLNSFRCQDGVICKNCYRIVSGNYASTITGLTLAELKKLYIRNAPPLDLGPDGFQATRKVSSLLLVDEKRHKFCILNNRKRCGNAARPEVFSQEELKSFHMNMEPAYSPEELKKMMADKNSGQTVRSLSVRITLKSGIVHTIPLFSSPIRISTYAFRQSYKLAQELLDALGSV